MSATWIINFGRFTTLLLQNLTHMSFLFFGKTKETYFRPVKWFQLVSRYLQFELNVFLRKRKSLS